MKFSWIILGLLLTTGAGALGAVIVGCGPEDKFCPATNGPCPPPLPPPSKDAGSEAGPADTGTDRRPDRRGNNN